MFSMFARVLVCMSRRGGLEGVGCGSGSGCTLECLQFRVEGAGPGFGTGVLG